MKSRSVWVSKALVMKPPSKRTLRTPLPFDALCEEVHKETAQQRLSFKTVTVKIRYQGFETHTKSKTLPRLTNRAEDLGKTAKELLLPYLRTDKKMRLIGVRVSNLVSCEKQKTLF